jgi:ribose transport system substrate-binding protein
MLRSFSKVVLLGSALVLLSGCGDRGSSSTTSGDGQGPDTPAKATAPLKIGVSIPAADHGWTAGVGWWARKAMADYENVEWVYATAVNPAKQVSDIEDMMAQGVQGLVVLATESAPLTPIARQAAERGIFLVNVDRGFLEPVADVFLEGDNRAFGRKSAQFIVDKLGPDGGHIVILRGIPSTVDTDRYEAAMEVFNDHPQIEVLAAQPGMWNRTKALEVMQSYLTQFDQIDVVWSSDDDMALGAEQAIREAGRADEMWQMPGAGMNDVIKKVMEGDPMYPADITYPPAMIAAGVHVAVGALRNDSPQQIAQRIPPHLRLSADDLAGDQGPDAAQKHIKIDVHLVTPDNAEEFYFPDSVY